MASSLSGWRGRLFGAVSVVVLVIIAVAVWRGWGDRLVVGQAAGAIVALALIPYFASIFRGETKPSIGAYAIKSFVSAVAVVSYFESGARSTVWTVGVFSFSAVVIFLLSLRYGVGGFKRFDLACLCGAVVAVVLWIRTGDPATALYASIAVRLSAALPLWRKLDQNPGTENQLSWVVTLFGEALNLVALMSLAPQISVLPITETVTTGVVVYMILTERARNPLWRFWRRAPATLAVAPG